MSSSEIKHNVYFDGKVQSLGIDTAKGPATVGVMKQGTYVFNTASPETMVVISGDMKTKEKGAEWLTHKPGDSFDVGANTSFDVVCDTDVAYICYYK